MTHPFDHLRMRSFTFLVQLHENQKRYGKATIPCHEVWSMTSGVKLRKDDVKDLLTYFEEKGWVKRVNHHGIQITEKGLDIARGDDHE